MMQRRRKAQGNQAAPEPTQALRLCQQPEECLQGAGAQATVKDIPAPPHVKDDAMGQASPVKRGRGRPRLPRVVTACLVCGAQITHLPSRNRRTCSLACSYKLRHWRAMDDLRSKLQTLPPERFATLSHAEKLIVEARYFADVPLTLRELAAQLGCSRQRVHQLEQQAVARLLGKRGRYKHAARTNLTTVR